MKEITGDLWDHIGKADAICVTTNGFVKRDGSAVMGRGCAKQAVQRIPSLAPLLGLKIKQLGLCVCKLKAYNNTEIIAFPVKPKGLHAHITVIDRFVVRHMVDKLKFDKHGTTYVPGWAAKANIKIIERSCKQLNKLTSIMNWNKVILPRPGCGAGELNWQNVKPVIQKILDNRFYCITYK